MNILGSKSKQEPQKLTLPYVEAMWFSYEFMKWNQYLI